MKEQYKKPKVVEISPGVFRLTDMVCISALTGEIIEERVSYKNADKEN